jgi:hypothetical protein
MSTFLTGLIGSLQFDKADLNRLHTSDSTFDIGSTASMTPVSDDLISPLEIWIRIKR